MCCYNGINGWVSAQYLQLEGGLEFVPSASRPRRRLSHGYTVCVCHAGAPARSPRLRRLLQPTFPAGRPVGATEREQFLDIGVLISTGDPDNYIPGLRVKVMDKTNGREMLSKVSTSTFYWTDVPTAGAAKKANVNFDQMEPSTISNGRSTSRMRQAKSSCRKSSSSAPPNRVPLSCFSSFSAASRIMRHRTFRAYVAACRRSVSL